MNGKRNPSLILGCMIILMLVAASLTFVSCSSSESAPQAVTLKFNSASAAPANFVGGDESQVVRCVSFNENAEGITFAPTKSRNFTISSLIFVNSSSQPGKGGNMEIVVAPVSGAENQFDLKKGRLYNVQESAVRTIISDYGITYFDWLTGTMSGSEKFPCCE